MNSNKLTIEQQKGFFINVNPFTHRIQIHRAVRATSAPSVAVARLQVLGTTCRWAGMLHACIPHSDRPGFDGIDRSCHVCSLTVDGAHLLVGVTAVDVSLKNMGTSRPLPSRSRRHHAGKRPEALWHGPTDPHTSCSPAATVWLVVSADLDEGRVASPTASIRPCSLLLAGCRDLADERQGRGALRFDPHLARRTELDGHALLSKRRAWR